MSEIEIDIMEMLERGTHPATISAVLEVPVTWVYEVSDSLQDREVFSPFKTVNS
jgi:sugar-specific transcriptional regulator TrmB